MKCSECKKELSRYEVYAEDIGIGATYKGLSFNFNKYQISASDCCEASIVDDEGNEMSYDEIKYEIL